MNEGMNAAGPGNDDYETPDWLFKALDTEFGFTFDAAASELNKQTELFSSAIDEESITGLQAHRIYCNPPYSKIERFLALALSINAPLWVFLLPVRTDTIWYRRLWESRRVGLRPLRKRIRFHLDGEPADSPRFGSIIAIIYPE